MRQTIFVRKPGKVYLREYSRAASTSVCPKRFYINENQSLCYGNRILRLFRQVESILNDVLDRVEEMEKNE